MGQQQVLKKSLNPFGVNNFYQLDIRLLQKMQNYTSSFPADIQQIITQAQQFYIKQPNHLLSDFFISQINDRFNNLTINKQAIQNVTNTKTILQIFHINPIFLNHKFWNQLQTIDKFVKYLQKIQQKYWIEQQLYDILERQQEQYKNKDQKGKLSQTLRQTNSIDSNKGKSSPQVSIRKPLKPLSSSSTYRSHLHQPLFKKLFYYYYLQLIRAFCGSKNGLQRANAMNYHVSIGRNILKIVSAQYISQEKLFQLLYYLVKIQKTQKSLLQLQTVSAEYQIYCLKHEHNISVSKAKLQKIKLFTRCYLDQAYFLAIKQAQDPQIVQDINGGDSGLMLKNFPINRVKQRNRNM